MPWYGNKTWTMIQIQLLFASSRKLQQQFNNNNNNNDDGDNRKGSSPLNANEVGVLNEA